MLWMLLATATAATPAPAAATDPGYDAVRTLAWRDEAGLSAAQTGELVDRLGKVGMGALVPCLPSPIPETPPTFTVVMQLDAAGKITRTWGKGEADLVACVQRGLDGKALFAPPQAPFHVAFELLPGEPA